MPKQKKQCHHLNIAQNDIKAADGVITHVQHRCLDCGAVSKWAETYDRTVGGGWTADIKFK